MHHNLISACDLIIDIAPILAWKRTSPDAAMGSEPAHHPCNCTGSSLKESPHNSVIKSCYSTDALVLQRDFTSATPATEPEVACDGSNRRRSCDVADRRSKPTPQADPAQVGARKPARASAPARHSAAGRDASPG